MVELTVMKLGNLEGEPQDLSRVYNAREPQPFDHIRQVTASTIQD